MNAVTSVETHRTRSPPNPANQADLVYNLVRSGRSEDARSLIPELIEHHRVRGTGASVVASAYASVGDREKAFEWLERAFQERSGYLALVAADSPYESMWADPRFRKLLERMELPSEMKPTD